MSSLKEEIYNLENELLKSEVRKSHEKIAELLCDDFIEYCSKGEIYNYKKGDIFQDENDNKELNCQIVDFNIKELSSNTVLALYKVIKHNYSNEKNKYSIRSSIWKNQNGKWKMFFHQGTLCDKWD